MPMVYIKETGALEVLPRRLSVSLFPPLQRVGLRIVEPMAILRRGG